MLVERVPKLLLEVGEALLDGAVVILHFVPVLVDRPLVRRQVRGELVVLVLGVTSNLLQVPHALGERGVRAAQRGDVLRVLVVPSLQVLQCPLVPVGRVANLLLEEGHALRQRDVLLVGGLQVLVAPLELRDQLGVLVRGVPQGLLDVGEALWDARVIVLVRVEILEVLVVRPLHVLDHPGVLVGRVSETLFQVRDPLLESRVVLVAILHACDLPSMLVVVALEFCQHPQVLVGAVPDLLLEEGDPLRHGGVELVLLPHVADVLVVHLPHLGEVPHVLLVLVCGIADGLLQEAHALLHVGVVSRPPDVGLVVALQFLQVLGVLLQRVAYVLLQERDAVGQRRVAPRVTVVGRAHGLLELGHRLPQERDVAAEYRHLLLAEGHLRDEMLRLHVLDLLDVRAARHAHGERGSRAGLSLRVAGLSLGAPRLEGGELRPANDAIAVGVDLVEGECRPRHCWRPLKNHPPLPLAGRNRVAQKCWAVEPKRA
mmetsp:Transcript_2405/g.6432  ORF Transcript_2405/g.6432 Transcript_2405/m.6432 type:complete len:486 (+) Transcript_2405:2547-4004(+)